ncbi:hypothetical protein HOO68_05890 [Candidatus Gracilibacteria bacterium]|nr:hypothetical protein [Candidatus Gracilibacteria bacterium]
MNYKAAMVKAIFKLRGKFEKEVKSAAKRKNTKKLKSLAKTASGIQEILADESNMWEDVSASAYDPFD